MVVDALLSAMPRFCPSFVVAVDVAAIDDEVVRNLRELALLRAAVAEPDDVAGARLRRQELDELQRASGGRPPPCAGPAPCSGTSAWPAAGRGRQDALPGPRQSVALSRGSDRDELVARLRGQHEVAGVGRARRQQERVARAARDRWPAEDWPRRAPITVCGIADRPDDRQHRRHEQARSASMSQITVVRSTRDGSTERMRDVADGPVATAASGANPAASPDSGGPPDSRRKTDESRADEHHRGLITKPGRRKADPLDRHRAAEAASAVFILGWLAAAASGDAQSPITPSEHQSNNLPAHDPYSSFDSLYCARSC